MRAAFRLAQFESRAALWGWGLGGAPPSSPRGPAVIQAQMHKEGELAGEAPAEGTLPLTRAGRAVVLHWESVLSS